MHNMHLILVFAKIIISWTFLHHLFTRTHGEQLHGQTHDFPETLPQSCKKQHAKYHYWSDWWSGAAGWWFAVDIGHVAHLNKKNTKKNVNSIFVRKKFFTHVSDKCGYPVLSKYMSIVVHGDRQDNPQASIKTQDRSTTTSEDPSSTVIFSANSEHHIYPLDDWYKIISACGILLNKVHENSVFSAVRTRAWHLELNRRKWSS